LQFWGFPACKTGDFHFAFLWIFSLQQIWISDQWSVPVIFTVSQLLKSKDQMYQVSLGARYWASSPDNGAEGWGFRAQLTLLFPKK